MDEESLRLSIGIKMCRFPFKILQDYFCMVSKISETKKQGLQTKTSAVNYITSRMQLDARISTKSIICGQLSTAAPILDSSRNGFWEIQI